MTYDLVRWGFGLLLFIILAVTICLITKKKGNLQIGKTIIISAFTSIIIAAALLLFPVENLFFSFKSVEDAYKYKHHEDLITYGLSEQGALCIGQKNDGSFVCYSIIKEGDKYMLPGGVDEDIRHRSSHYGYFLIKNFGQKTVIITQVSGCAYKEQDFVALDNGFFYAEIDSPFLENHLTNNGERIVLV